MNDEFKLSDGEEEYYYEKNCNKTINNRLEELEKKVYTIDEHQKEIKNIYIKISNLEQRIFELELENNSSFFDTIDEIWEDFKNFVKYKL
tara:strand:- start:614 stop:883 length:270 start_codon:yes stop_codon:yes gene_type:complete